MATPDLTPPIYWCTVHGEHPAGACPKCPHNISYHAVVPGPATCFKHGQYVHNGVDIKCPLCKMEEDLNRAPPVVQAGPQEPNFIDPPHYVAGRKFEPYDVISDWFSGNYNLGQVCKYISRAGRKGPALTDLKKAAWYLQKEINRHS